MFFLLWGCPNPNPPQPKYSCVADVDWINNPTQPSDVGEQESFCDFYQFGWKWFLSQTSLSISDKSERVFETHRVYHPNKDNQCSMEYNTGRELNISLLEPRLTKSDFEDKQADQHALYDTNGNILYYNIWYSKEMCDANEEFVEGTIEIKASWMKIKEINLKDYFWIEKSEKEYLGLVGIHFAIWTKKHHEMLWYSWEHKDNAPLCNGESEIKSYNFASKQASECLSKKEECSKYQFNIPTKVDSNPPLISIPNEVCRKFRNGNQIEKSVNGNDNELNSKVIDELNEQIVGQNGLLNSLKDEHHMKVWSNYQMIGGLWTKNGVNSGKSPVPTKDSKGDPSSMQRGSLELTNTSMETFEQGDTSFVPNCFGCHNYDEKDQTNVSHIYKHLKSNKAIE